MSTRKKAIAMFAGIVASISLVVFALWWNGILYDWITPSDRVVIWSYGFHAPEVVVKKGTTVIWENLDPVPHLVRSGSPENPTGVFTSELLYEHNKFQYTFNDAGAYEYYCVPHPLMRAKITVVP